MEYFEYTLEENCADIMIDAINHKEIPIERSGKTSKDTF